MPDLHYEHPRLASIYDVSSGWSEDREFYLNLAGEAPQDILELGCGTGLLSRAYASRGHRVTGLDPARAMLEVGRSAPHGDRVSWAQGEAQTWRTPARFDLILMTGHAFQVLLEESDLEAALARTREHLRPGGRFVFESRNPAIDWATRWDTTSTLETEHGEVVVEERRILSFDHERITFDCHYHFPDGVTLTSRSELRFFSEAVLRGHLSRAGFEVEAVLGDWDGAAWEPGESLEMIFLTSRSF